MKLPKVTQEQAKGLSILAIVAVIIIIVFIFGKDLKNVFDNILTDLGLKTDPITKLAQDNALAANMSSSNPSSAFSPSLYNNNPDQSTLDYPTLQGMSQTIWNSVSPLPNWLVAPNSSAALAAIKQCNNKVDVSNLTVVFQQSYSQDLYDYMAKNYTDNTNIQGLNQILNFVNGLPTV